MDFLNFSTARYDNERHFFGNDGCTGDFFRPIAPFTTFVHLFTPFFMQLLTEIMLFPPVAVWAAAVQSDGWLLEIHENYQKGGYRNRYYISGPNGPVRLTVPLEKGKNDKTSISEVRISRDENWELQHLRSIQTAYGKSPYFEDYFPPIKSLFDGRKELLLDLNVESLKISRDIVAPKLTLEFTSAWQSDYSDKPEIDDERGHYKPGLLKKSRIVNHYPQVFEDKFGFQPNLSILDLIFCLGPEGSTFLKRYRRE